MEAHQHFDARELDWESQDDGAAVGRLATEAALYAVPPVDINLPRGEFDSAVHGLIIEGCTDPNRLAFERQMLLSVRQAISSERGDVALQIHELTVRFDELTRRQIHVHGYLSDRPPEDTER